MRYDIVFEGGGAKGMVFVGACEEFFKRGHTFDRLLGTSAGAITATLLAAGYTPKEMLAALAENGDDGKSVFTRFMGPPPRFTEAELQASATRRLLDAVDFTFVPDFVERKVHQGLIGALEGSDSFRHVLSLVERGGWFAARRFVTWLSAKLDAARTDGTPRNYSKMTLAQFHAATGVDLSMVASDTTDSRLLVLNHRTAPDCPVVYAVRMSMSIPLVWDEVTWRAEWGPYRGRDIAGHGVVDGGMLSNFPLELFISGAPQVTKVMGPKQDTPVLGLMIDESMEVPGAGSGAAAKRPGALAEFALVTRIGRLIDTATTAHDKRVIEDHGELIVRLPAKGYGTTEFDMSEARRDALVEAARTATRQWLATAPRAVPPMSFGPGAPATKASRRADAIALDLLD